MGEREWDSAIYIEQQRVERPDISTKNTFVNVSGRLRSGPLPRRIMNTPEALPPSGALPPWDIIVRYF